MADDVKVDKPGELEVWHKNPLERAGWKKSKLIRELALGEISQTRLGELYGVSQASISRFASRHSGDIEMVRAELAERAMDGMAHLWVSGKVNRVAEYQDIAEQMARTGTPRASEIRIQALKAVAEELGDLPARANIEVNQASVTHIVLGIDPQDLT